MEELGLLLKASKLAKPPWAGVWPTPKPGNEAKAGTTWGAAKGSPPISASRSVLAFLVDEWEGGWELLACELLRACDWLPGWLEVEAGSERDGTGSPRSVRMGFPSGTEPWTGVAETLPLL